LKLNSRWRSQIIVTVILLVFTCINTTILTAQDTAVQSKIALPESYEQRFYKGLRYGLFIPENYTDTTSYPLIVYLHGSTDTVSWDLGWYHDRVQKKKPSFVLTPKSIMRKNGWGSSWDEQHSPDMIKTLAVIDNLLEEFNIDTTRLFIHGASMGGFGVFSVLAKEPGLFTAAFSICGGGDPKTAELLINIPLWVFHGSKDKVIPVEQSRNLVKAIRQAGGKKVRYTEYPGIGHASWTPAWKEPAIEDWLLAHQKGGEHAPPEIATNCTMHRMENGQVKLTWYPPDQSVNPDNRVWYYLLFRERELVAEPGPNDTLYVDSPPMNWINCKYAISVVNFYFQESDKAFFKHTD
jgi:predicted peptidase